MGLTGQLGVRRATRPLLSVTSVAGRLIKVQVKRNHAGTDPAMIGRDFTTIARGAFQVPANDVARKRHRERYSWHNSQNLKCAIVRWRRCVQSNARSGI